MPAEGWIPWFGSIAPPLLLLFGLGFLIANIKLVAALWAYRRRLRSALLIWEGVKPKYYSFSLALGVVLGLLLIVEAFVLRRSPRSIFGEAMMFIYYGYAFPLSTRIRRGFYGDGVWSDSGFMKWSEISAVSWKEEPKLTLVLISHVQSIARRLDVPGPLYGQARRLLRDRIQANQINIGGTGLDLGARDDRDAI